MISNLTDAINLVISMLKNKVIENRNDRYCNFIKDENGVKLCVCFKRDYYKNFQFHFPKVGYVGYGQVANKHLLEYCDENGYEYIMVMPDGKVYRISPRSWLDYYKVYKTDVPHLDGEIAIPLKMLRRMD
jgi:hypothetical protein